MTDDGKVYVGAVTKDALVKAAERRQVTPSGAHRTSAPPYAPYGGAEC